MRDMHLEPITKIPVASLDLPGSKSIANRVLPLAAISHGESVLHNIPRDSEDVHLMLEALKALGIAVTELKSDNSTTNSNAASYKIIGCGGDLPVKDATIFCGNSGTTIRFLTAILALMPGRYCLDGIKRMHERPIKDLVMALRQVGSQVKYVLKDGYPPLQTSPFTDNHAGRVKISGKISSQYLTGVLMALPLLNREIVVEIEDELISQPYVTITVELLDKFGCHIVIDGNKYMFRNSGCELTGINYTVEPDASSASYFLALGAIAGDITVNNLSENSLQGDRNFAKVLALMGANVTYANDSVRVKRGAIKAIDVNMEDMPDVAMTIAVMALFAHGATIIRGIHSWKVKETDRLIAMYNELTKLGAIVAITDNSITIMPPQMITPNVAIDTYNDHRMAMCFSLVAAYGIPIIIKDYACVGKTFPNYFDVFKSLGYKA